MITRNVTRDQFYTKSSDGDFDVLLTEFKMEIRDRLKPFYVTPAFHCRPDLVALALYSDSRLWWILMEFNAIDDIWNDFKTGTLIDTPSVNDVNNFVMKMTTKGIFK